MKTITLNLPEQAMKRAQQAAAALQRPVEEILTDILVSALPTVHDAPANMQAELIRMTWLDTQELWDIARLHMTMEAQEQMRQLTQLHEHRPLTLEEQNSLEELRQEYGRVTLLKARAYALLSLRGGTPLLDQV